MPLGGSERRFTLVALVTFWCDWISRPAPTVKPSPSAVRRSLGYWYSPLLDIGYSPLPSPVACLLTTYVSEIGRRRIHLSRLSCEASAKHGEVRFDLPPEVIGLIYQHRWQVEIFFRFFKHTLGCRHLLSHCENGIEMQVYAAIIACLIIALWTGRKPTLSTYRMLCWHFTGWADDDELTDHINSLKDQETVAVD